MSEEHKKMISDLQELIAALPENTQAEFLRDWKCEAIGAAKAVRVIADSDSIPM